ncbi:apolipoprotein O, b isoform X1 [Hoplias malabaricus]|uniref:apolipoprotein O, b isoform X1 n=1 Tax=Hoplias malabaricus TaxID=27720 RepID=UPI00346228A4
MLSFGRMAKLASPVVVSGSLYPVSGSVFADSETKESDFALRVDELSLYTTPNSQGKYVEPEVGQVEQGVTSLRKSAEPYMVWCQDKMSYALDKAETFCKNIEPGFDATVQTVKDTYEFLNEPPSEFYPSVGVVGFSGILGLYLAKGCRVKRLLFPAGLMTLSASLFYPQYTASLTKMGKDQISSWGSQGRVLLEGLWKGKSSG